jgi:hypothetical protein
VLVYTLMLVPVVYGGAKLATAPGVGSAHLAAGIATIVIIPLPVLLFWVYVVSAWQGALLAALRGDLRRSDSAIMKAYRQQPEPQHALSQAQLQQQRGKPTLALLGEAQENPTLIIRDKRPGEEEFEHMFGADGDDASSDGGGSHQQLQGPASRGRPHRAGDSHAGGEEVHLWGL